MQRQEIEPHDLQVNPRDHIQFKSIYIFQESDVSNRIQISHYYHNSIIQVSCAKRPKSSMAGKSDTENWIANSVLLRLAELTEKQQRNVNAHGLGRQTCAQIVKLVKV